MKGDMKHNSQLKVKGTALKILASENTKTSFLKFKLFLISLLGLNYAFQGAAIRCMLYYLNKKKRLTILIKNLNEIPERLSRQSK